MSSALQLDLLAEWSKAQRVGDNIEITSIVTDTRDLVEGSLFVALKGERFDGYEFCDSAVQSGASALLVERLCPELNVPQLIVDDTLKAYGLLANGYRRTLDVKLLAITGSAGKTTVKQMCSSILSRQGRTSATEANFNNEIGVPKTILNIAKEDEYAVVEMGAAKPHDISYLCQIAEPDVVAVTNVLEAHIEGFGSVDAVANTKGEIYAGVRSTGACVFVADSPYIEDFKARAASDDHFICGIGEDKRLDISATDIVLSPSGQPSFVLSTPEGVTSIQLPVIGRHNVMNAVIAASLCYLSGASLTAIEQGLAGFESAKGRMNIYQLGNDVTLIDDTYNANPGSMLKAIEALKSLPGESWLIAGHMAELGVNEVEMHRRVGEQAKKLGVTRVSTVGTLAKYLSDGFGERGVNHKDVKELTQALDEAPRSSLNILVKGSRSAKMEVVVNHLLKEKG